jgi:threonine/homoserine/homoserine lactone efflux protein
MVLAAGWLSALLIRSKWVSRGLNWSFAAVFTAFAATILLTEGRR